MIQSSPVLPNYETPLQEPNLDPTSEDPFGDRMNTAYYQFLNLLLQAVLPASQPAIAAAAKAGAVTLNSWNGIITTEALTTDAGGTYTLSLSDQQISETSNVIVAVSNKSNTGGAALLASVVVEDGAATIKVSNIGTTAFNGTLQIQFVVR